MRTSHYDDDRFSVHKYRQVATDLGLRYHDHPDGCHRFIDELGDKPLHLVGYFSDPRFKAALDQRLTELAVHLVLYQEPTAENLAARCRATSYLHYVKGSR